MRILWSPSHNDWTASWRQSSDLRRTWNNIKIMIDWNQKWKIVTIDAKKIKETSNRWQKSRSSVKWNGLKFSSLGWVGNSRSRRAEVIRKIVRRKMIFWIKIGIENQQK